MRWRGTHLSPALGQAEAGGSLNSRPERVPGQPRLLKENPCLEGGGKKKNKKIYLLRGMVAHTFNPSYSPGRQKQVDLSLLSTQRVPGQQLIMEESHKSNTSETAPQPGSTVQGTHISQIAHQVSSLSESEESQDSSDSIGSSQKAHGILARRPSYRKILKDLSSEDTRGRKGDGESPGISAVTSMSVPTPIYQTSSGQYIAIAPNGALQLASPGTDGVQGLQTLAMTNSSSTQQGTILQYAQTSDGQQILVPSNQVVVQTASGDMQTYQIRTTPSATSLPQTVVMTSPVTLTSQTTKTDDPQLKREIRLMKNREAARECRRKKKEYVKCLENRVAVLENQNKTLIEELKTLKDLYSHKSV